MHRAVPPLSHTYSWSSCHDALLVQDMSSWQRDNFTSTLPMFYRNQTVFSETKYMTERRPPYYAFISQRRLEICDLIPINSGINKLLVWQKLKFLGHEFAHSYFL